MRITNPDLIWLFFTLIPLVLVMGLFYLGGIRGLQKLTGTWRFVSIKRIYRVRFLVSSLLLILTLLSLLIALSGMSWQKKPEKDDSVGLEVLFVLDVSRSMLADDIEPSRLSKSISLMHTVIDSVENSRFGIVVFKGEAVVAVPMTEDVMALGSFLSSANPGIITSPGSNQEKALKLALKSFSGNSINKRVIVFITDGESLEGDVFRAASEAVNDSIPVYSVVAGTSQGSKIPLDEGFVKNRQGREVVTKPNFNQLRELSELTYGKTFMLEESQVIAKVTQEIKSLEHNDSSERIKYINIIQYRPFLILALIFLFLYIFVKEWRWSEIF